jgi:hypothetical protein
VPAENAATSTSAAAAEPEQTLITTIAWILTLVAY